MTSKDSAAASRIERRLMADRRASGLRALKRLEDAVRHLDQAFESFDRASRRPELRLALEQEVLNLLQKARKAVDDAIAVWAGREK